MTSARRLLLALALAAAVPASAAEASLPADLPPAEVVLRALGNHPEVRAAQARTRAARAEHERLRVGGHEYGLRMGVQRRDVSREPDYTEWDVALERGLRLPEKGRLDDRIGAQGVEEAEERVGDARHEAARQLLSYWYAALRGRSEVSLWRDQIALLEEARRIVETRVKRGDAARLDGLQADAALAQARSQARQAEARAQAAAAELRARFPELPAAEGGPAEPPAPPGDEAGWIERTLEHNHELLAAQRAVEKARLTARRVDRERTPDPVLGLRYANERGGDEQVLGVTLAIPLPGQARRADAGATLAQAEDLAEREAATRRRLGAEAAVNWQRAAGGVEAHRRLAEAAEAMSRHAELAGRAHQLGELALSEALLARRNALESQLAAEQARLDANEAIARLLLDAHRLWPLGEGGEHH